MQKNQQGAKKESVFVGGGDGHWGQHKYSARNVIFTFSLG